MEAKLHLVQDIIVFIMISSTSSGLFVCDTWVCVCVVAGLRVRVGVNRQLINDQPFKSRVRRKKTHGGP